MSESLYIYIYSFWHVLRIDYSMNIHLLSYIKSMQKNWVTCINKIMSYIEFFEKKLLFPNSKKKVKKKDK